MTQFSPFWTFAIVVAAAIAAAVLSPAFVA